MLKSVKGCFRTMKKINMIILEIKYIEDFLVF